MERESPVQTRKSLEVVEFFRKSGIGFVAMPIFNDADRDQLLEQVQERLEAMATKIENEASNKRGG